MQMLETLRIATRRYRLRDTGISNLVIAEHLGVHIGEGDSMGSPSCLFYQQDGYLAAIRTEQDEMAIFHVFQSIQAKMEGIGDRIE